jgi:hypothetical protein
MQVNFSFFQILLLLKIGKQRTARKIIPIPHNFLRDLLFPYFCLFNNRLYLCEPRARAEQVEATEVRTKDDFSGKGHLAGNLRILNLAI